ncbi:MAG: PQQ-dependent sugar dehydrogenase [Gemmatirosa sp.]|nr:PQQ-dependent sugar dehydrogenase [Gemmatirosa sp.]
MPVLTALSLRGLLAGLISLAALPSCGDDGHVAPDSVTTSTVTLRAREVASGLDSPVFLTAPNGDARLFVVEQRGRIRIVENGALRPTPFLDVTGSISAGGERGLLGLAFHPKFAQNGFFYVNFTDPRGDTRVVRYHVGADRNVADASSATLVITVPQPYANHNGGMVAFGPDGMLYVGMGDGGSGGDPQGNGQNLGTLLGKLLRLDVDGAAAGAAYAVPRDNPFVARAGARPEIWAFGLRNPWRFSFDPAASRLYIADVGQNRREEIDVAGATEAGLNYGWNTTEGTECYNAPSCNRSGLREPIAEYGHDDGCSITGGYVYRGRIAGIRGQYFYSDYCKGWLRSLQLGTDGTVAARYSWDVGSLGSVASFGVDASGELYVLSANGKVYALEER